MQKAQPSRKPLIITIIVVILIIGGYFYYTGSPNDSTLSSLSSSDTGGDQIVSSQALVLLNQISSIHIDNKLFSSPVYQSLVDHTVKVLEQSVGRSNPFAPTSGVIIPPKTTKAP